VTEPELVVIPPQAPSTRPAGNPAVAEVPSTRPSIQVVELPQ
jgi:hypothetical protein